MSVLEKKRGAKDDLRDAWARTEDIRVGRVQTRVYKAPEHLAGLRSAACAYRLATRDVVRTKNRLKAVFRSRGIRSDSGVYEAASRDRWLRVLPSSSRELASWFGQELDGLVRLREEGRNGFCASKRPERFDFRRDCR